MPQPPKPPGQRRRRNLDAPKWRHLPEEGSGLEAPPLPDRPDGWSKYVREWWATIWASPMALVWLDADLAGLHELAELRQRFHEGGTASSAEMRALEDRFGLSPKARKLLQWEVSQATQARGPSEPDEPGEETPKPPPADRQRLRAV